MSQLKRYNGTSWENVGGSLAPKTSKTISDTDTYCCNYLNNKIENEYSTTQKTLTNKKLDGKPVYRAYLDFAHSSTGTYTYTHNLGIDKIVSIQGFCTVASQTIASHGYRVMPMANYIGNAFSINAITKNTISTNAVGWSDNHAYIWIEYTEVS